MGAVTPFQILQDIDQRCRRHAKGLPTGAQVEDDWVGIGFRLHGQRLVSRMSDIAEILSPPETIRVPGVRDWVKGLANVRGNLMPILDMDLFLNSSDDGEPAEKRILVINKHSVVAGLLVQEVFGLRRFKPELQSLDVAADMGPLEPYVEGAFFDNGTRWNIFSIEKLVDHEPFLKVV